MVHRTRRKKPMSAARKRAARAVVNKLTQKMAQLITATKRNTSEFKKLDKRLAKVQKATQYRW
jgi:shikimate 5-dehydrogenase